MIVLGVTAKLDGHDPAAALVVDGEVVCAAEEERFTGVRHAPGATPTNAVAWCLGMAGVSPGDVDVVASGWDPRRQPDAEEPAEPEVFARWATGGALSSRRVGFEVDFIRHHEAHAAGAWTTCPFDSAAKVIVVDGSGERESISCFDADTSGLRLLWDRGFANSLGFFYEALSVFIGLGKFGAGKTMGLSALGNKKFTIPLPTAAPPRADTVPDGELYREIALGWIDRFGQASGLRRRFPVGLPGPDARVRWSNEHIDQEYADLAASAQDALERAMAEVIDWAVGGTLSDLVLSGGVALNCVMNGRLLDHEHVRRLYVQPASTDAGVAVGAAAQAYFRRSGSYPTCGSDVYCGPRWTDGQVGDLLKAWGVPAVPIEDEPALVSDLIDRNQIIARFRGAAEFGPRALGHRSILADPRLATNKQRVNRIKRREAWRPFAPMLTDGVAARLFERDDLDSPAMTIALAMNELGNEHLPAVAHVDGSTRPQTVSSENAEIYAILQQLDADHGLPALLNTSFNVQGPMVLSPKDALQTFITSSLDTLLIEGFRVDRPY